MSVLTGGAQRRRRSVAPRARLLAAVLTLAGVLAAGLAFTGVLPAPLAFGAGRNVQPTHVAFGLPPRAGLRRIGPAPAATPVTLQLGLVADQQRIARTARAASDPSSPTYGTYLTLVEFAKRLGAPVSRQRAVLDALRAAGAHGAVDATALRVTASMTIGKLERLFATRWSMYATGTADVSVALPDASPKIPKGLRGNVDAVAGASPFVFSRPQLSRGRVQVTRAPPVRTSAGQAEAGGTPTRTGTPGSNCLTAGNPAALDSPIGLFPSQVLTAYGVSSLHDQGLLGQGVRLAIVGEGPTPLSDVELFRECFGFTGTPLHIHGGAGVQPILESSLDAMVVSAVAPQLAAFDLWVRPLADNSDDGDVGKFLQLLAAPLEAAKTGLPPPDVVSVSYGICETQVAPFTAARTLVERLLAAYATLGITVVVASGDSGSSTCARGVPNKDLTSAEKKPHVSWPASSPWVLSVGGTNLTLNADNTIASTGVWNDTAFPAPFAAPAAGGGGQSLLASRPWWQPRTSFALPDARLVPDVAAFADAKPGYVIICSAGVQGCTPQPLPGPSVAFVGGTSAAAPLLAGMIALWIEQARVQHLPRVGFVPPLLYSTATKYPSSFVDVTLGGNAIYNVPCCKARAGYDLASGLGSPRADGVASHLP